MIEIKEWKTHEGLDDVNPKKKDGVVTVRKVPVVIKKPTI